MRSLQCTAIARKRNGDVSVLERVIVINGYFNSIREDRDQNSLTATFCAPRDPTELQTFIIICLTLHLDVFEIKSCLTLDS